MVTRIALTSSSLRPSPVLSYLSKMACQKSLLFGPAVGLDVLLDDVVLLEVVRLEQKGLRFEPTTILDEFLDGRKFSLMLNVLSKRGYGLRLNFLSQVHVPVFPSSTLFSLKLYDSNKRGYATKNCVSSPRYLHASHEERGGSMLCVK